MSDELVFSDWKALVSYPAKGVKPRILVESPGYKALVAGLEAGTVIPPHPEGAAVFHFLEGKGRMTLGEKSFDVRAGTTVVIPDGARRSLEAETRLAFLAVRMAKEGD